MDKLFDDPIGEVPDLTTEQMIEVDRAMIEDYEIELIQMMENAGRNLAHLARRRFLEGSRSARCSPRATSSGWTSAVFLS